MARDSQLPSDVHAEKVILASILGNNEIFFDGAAELISTDFSLDSHQRIFSAISSILFGLVENVDSADVITVASELRKKKELSAIGGVAYLSDLGGDHLNQTKNIGNYVTIVKEKAQLRQLMMIFHDAGIRVIEQVEPASAIMADVQNRLVEESAEAEGKAVRIGEVGPKVEKRIEEKRHISTEHAALGLTWGISKLDDFTKGAHDGELTVLGAESGSGKTSVAIQMILENAKNGVPCYIFSEMSKVKLTQRFYPQMSKIITTDMMRDPRLINLHTHIPEIQRITRELESLPIWIDDTVGMDINVMVARIRMMCRKYKIKLFVIDFLQLILNKSKRESVESLVDIMHKLRDLVTAEPTIHILLLSQFSKADGFTKRRRRTRNDLLGSSSIHQDAQNVLILTIEDEEKKDKNDLLDVEFMVDKQRDGRKGRVTTCFDRAHLRYREPEPPTQF